MSTPPDVPLAALRRHFGFPDFRPGQGELVRAVLAGRDALGILPTGGGKSVCFQVPAALLRGLTLVVSPLLSLMGDQVGRCNDAGIPGGYLGSSQTPAERRRTLAAAVDGRLKVLFVAPERLSSPHFRPFLRGLDVNLFVIDEAHCISLWGNEFRPSYKLLSEVRRALAVPTLALTATATPRVRAEIVRVLGLKSPRTVVQSFDRPNLAWRVSPARGRDDKRRHLIRLLRGIDGSAVVYAGTRRTVEALRDTLAGLGWPVEAYHAGLPGPERSRVQEAFMSGDARIVVATNAFGMGIDKPDVRRVVHWQLPGTLEDYYQEAGRAGRDGAPALCCALFGPGDAQLRRGFLVRTHPSGRRVKQVWRVLRSRLGGSGRGRFRLAELGRGFAAPMSPEELASCLRILSDAGAIRLLSAIPQVAGGQVELGLRRGTPDLAPARKRRRVEEKKLAQVLRYARQRKCRRRFLLGYFGERPEQPRCGRCDRCKIQ